MRAGRTQKLFCLATLVTGLVLATGTSVSAAASGTEVDARYAGRDPASFTAPRQPISRKDYVDYVRPLAQGFENGPDRAQYGPRHALPALAVFSLEGDRRLGLGIKKTLLHYKDWVDKCVREEKGVFSMEGATLCTFFFRELRKRDFMSPADERWAKELLLTLREYQCAWRPGDGLWRGSHHRSQCQGINHALAAALYPDEPGVNQWRKFAEAVWGDWWNFRDVGINDTGYFYSSLGNIVRAAELLDRHEVFTDPQSRKIFDRILYRISPNGAAVPYGPQAGRQLSVTELGDAHTGPTRLSSTQYAWEGDVEPRRRVQSVCLLLPHAPTRDAAPLANRIRVLLDEPGRAAVSVLGEDGCELAILNERGATLDLRPAPNLSVNTDAQAAYIRTRGGRSPRVLLLQAAQCTVGGKVLLQNPTRSDFEMD